MTPTLIIAKVLPDGTIEQIAPKPQKKKQQKSRKPPKGIAYSGREGFNRPEWDR